MTLIQVGGRSLDIREDDERARYASIDRITGERPAGARSWDLQPVRMLLDLQRNFGGLAPRALLGAQFTGKPGLNTTYEVLVGDDFERLSGARDKGKTVHPARGGYQDWQYIAGLPREFTPAVLSGLLDDEWCDVELPSGTVVVDRAGFDEQGSSAVMFELAGRMLRCLFAVALSGGDVESEARRLIQRW